MMQTPAEPDPTSAIRRSVYAILIVVGAAGLLGRIMAVDAVDSDRLQNHLYREYLAGRRGPDWEKKLPFLSANDRSRWLTIRSLVEHGTYRIDEVFYEPNWNSIDVVKHDDEGKAAYAADQGHLYSSKPPLLATIVAGEYWLIHKLTGYSMREHPYAIGRFMLATINIPVIMLMWALLARYVERYGRTDFGRMFVMAGAIFGSMQTTFAVSLNNHLVAAASAMVLLDAIARIVGEGNLRLRWFLIAGLSAAFMAANELPALSLTAITGAGLLWRYPRQTLLGFVPGAALVMAAALGTNYAAHGILSPPYSQRDPDNNWYIYEYYTGQEVDVVVGEGDQQKIEKVKVVRKSYWSEGSGRNGVDLGEPSPREYAFHVLIGHHGIFSLTPMWLLAFVGMGMLCLRRGDSLRALALGIALATFVCMVFYLTRPQIDRNYGGTASGFRWVFWFAPLWSAMMLPLVDACARRGWSRWICLLLLAGSIVSVTFPTWNPWTKPWLTHFFEWMEWAKLPGD